MFKFFIFLILSPLLFAQSISPVNATVELNKPFILKSSKNLFDNSLFYTHEPLLKCQPALSAVYKVEAADKLKVLPKKLLQSNTKYQCDYKNESFTFTTAPLTVNEALYFKNEKILRLSFNDEIDNATIKKGINLKKLEHLKATKLQYKIIAQDKHNIVLQVVEKVGDSKVLLFIDKNLKTKHLSTLSKAYEKTFNKHDAKVKLDSNKKKLTIKDQPRMVALENGKFALRIFLEDNLNGKSNKFIKIKGIQNLQVSNYQYMGYYEREKFGVNSSYYYHDVTSDEFKANTSYNITLKKGLKLYSRELKDDLSYKLKTPNRAKAILFDKEKHYISSYGELSFSSVNVEDATLVVERILDDNLRYFINFSNANKYNVDAYTKEVFTKKLTLHGKNNQIARQKFKLSDLSSKALTTGIYKVSLHYETSDGEKTTEHLSSKVLFISDLGLSVNLSKTQAFVNVLSLSTMKPIKNAEVLIYGKNNALLGTAQTNADGVAIVNNPKLLKRNPKALVVKSKNDKNFLLLNESISSPMPSSILKEKERFKAHIYFQSNILRPAAKLNALITVKDKDFISASKLPVKLILRNPKNDISHQKVYHTDEYGLIDFNYQFSNSDKLGNYHLYVKLGDNVLAKKKLKVEAFM
ncbi:MAG: Alpha-2-macroglobulin, partial [uncultured Sulfurovum sp.]